MPIELQSATASIPPYLPVASITDPTLRSIPPLESFQTLEAGESPVKSYQIRVRRPRFSVWLLLGALFFAGPALWFLVMEFEEHVEYRNGEPDNPLVVLILCEVAVVAALTAGFFILRRRGHTFLYLTNRRLIVLELSQSLLTKEQTLLNFNIGDISGFQLLAQRGLRKLLGILLLREKRAFYLSIATRTSCNVEIGAMSSRGSKFQPGGDAVALCGELDAQVLALRGTRAA